MNAVEVMKRKDELEETMRRWADTIGNVAGYIEEASSYCESAMEHAGELVDALDGTRDSDLQETAQNAQDNAESAKDELSGEAQNCYDIAAEMEKWLES